LPRITNDLFRRLRRLNVRMENKELRIAGALADFLDSLFRILDSKVQALRAEPWGLNNCT